MRLAARFFLIKIIQMEKYKDQSSVSEEVLGMCTQITLSKECEAGGKLLGANLFTERLPLSTNCRGVWGCPQTDAESSMPPAITRATRSFQRKQLQSDWVSWVILLDFT